MNQVIRFEEQVTILRERLAHIHEQNEEFAQAAKVLSEIPLEGTGRCESFFFFFIIIIYLFS